ncbi:hypothetical protein VNO78_11199 [Psophocarpus tetragonolobus]|uniref:Hexosyltransferase n=1 Tax=Psophocarpus tetragonolobus TaxID=3891 RepID=A0AAN9XN78_PSOTE
MMSMVRGRCSIVGPTRHLKWRVPLVSSPVTAGAISPKSARTFYSECRFRLEMYPKLYKILLLDDDVMVQKDLTCLWKIDLDGKVNGVVESETIEAIRKEIGLTILHVKDDVCSKPPPPQESGKS